MLSRSQAIEKSRPYLLLRTDILQKTVVTLFFFYKNIVFPSQAEYSYFSADFRL